MCILNEFERGWNSVEDEVRSLFYFFSFFFTLQSFLTRVNNSAYFYVKDTTPLILFLSSPPPLPSLLKAIFKWSHFFAEICINLSPLAYETNRERTICLTKKVLNQHTALFFSRFAATKDRLSPLRLCTKRTLFAGNPQVGCLLVV